MRSKYFILFFLLTITTLLIFGPLLGMNHSVNVITAVLVGLVFLLIHGSLVMGWRNLLVFLALTVTVSFSAEAIGVATGLIFGHYHYTDLLGPKILGVPPLIQVAYASMGYASLMVARILLDLENTTPQKIRTILGMTIVAALLMVAWDVAMDPYQSTLAEDWLWEDGGAYFGVGIHNYIGWFITVFTFMLLYQLYAKWYPEPLPSDIKISWLLSLQAIIYYALSAVDIILIPLVGGYQLPATTSYTGTLQSLEYSLSLVCFFVMGVPAIIAFVRLVIKRDKI